jgi:signal transduction histidine kinase
LLTALKENPLQEPVLGPVIDAMAAAESALIARDSSLKPRRGRGPRLVGTEPNGDDDALRARIRELEQELRVREEHLAMVAHDLRSPLSPVLLLVDRIKDEAATAEMVPAAWLAPRIDGVAHRLDQFVAMLNRLLDATRIQTGFLALDPQELDLVAVTEAISVEVARDAHDVPIRIDASRPVTGRWDRPRIEQIIRNLLSNAIKYGAGKPVEVTISEDGERAVLSIKDGGIGVPTAERERIFERYTRVSRAPSGLGLGLWIVRELCTAMRGTIEVDSAPGQGSRFTVVLPRRPGPVPV